VILAVGIAVTTRIGVMVFFSALPLCYVFSILAEVFFGTPIFLLGLRFNLIKWWSALPAGFAVGALATLVLRLPNLAPARELLGMGFIGAASGFGFWLVWKQAASSVSV